MQESRFCCCTSRHFLIIILSISLTGYVLNFFTAMGESNHSTKHKHPASFIIPIGLTIFFIIGACTRNTCLLMTQLVLSAIGTVCLILYSIVFVAGVVGVSIANQDNVDPEAKSVLIVFTMLLFLLSGLSILSTYLIYKVYQDAKQYNEVARQDPYINA
ncbi:hypothetical protein WR25_03306 [Diploscapter pachys]|uniref:Uncharacterized protein n=1 Tax=Diploscapter pachys TaxID=2018661 RepID=A0A2A2L3J5_9BILA|nr:hypothetical protein WR25_03306 [Diploscapter pachys]